MADPPDGGGVVAAGWGRDNDGGLESDCTAQTGPDLAAGTSAALPCRKRSERNEGKQKEKKVEEINKIHLAGILIN